MTTLTVNSDTSLSDAIGRLRDEYKAHRFLRLNIKTGKDRSIEANAAMWAALTDVSKQVDWYGRKLTPEEWKHVMSASLKKQDVVPGLDGGFVVLGISTSKMTIKEMSDMIELIHAFGAQHGVTFREEA